jgi:uncharacterized protein (TIGR00297 family)
LNRLLNYATGLLVIYLFVLEGNMEDHFRIITGLVLSVSFGSIAFIFNWITLDASRTIVVLGTIIYGFGNWLIVSVVLFFFITSIIFSRYRRKLKIAKLDEAEISALNLQKRRNGTQLWANGFWMAFFIFAWFLYPSDGFLIAVFAVIASAASDTWATELGSANPWKTRLITSFKKVKPGTDGGISLKGIVAALMGSAAIALFTFLDTSFYNPMTFYIVFGAGFLGCITDSYLGAIFQNRVPDKSSNNPGSENGTKLTNSMVNWISTGTGGMIAFVFTQLLLI